MRTLEQIQNLRCVLRGMYGPFVTYFLRDEDIDKWANRIQAEINMLPVEINKPPVKSNWDVKVRFENNINATWDDIKKESMIPIASFAVISDKCIKLLKKYPDIISIQIINKGTEEKIVFERDS